MDKDSLDFLFEMLRKRRLEGSIGPVDYRIGTKDIRGQASLFDAMLNAKLKYNGDMNLSVEKPMFGGNLTFHTSRDNGNNNYYLQYQKDF